ncbi:ABC-type antimicrobial peptide transport system, permease component [Chitinophaga jiangningensis]|uniref:ABC-type antimicrobial peptide transport system, permease component n=1 Tax=Chitinophaga jiangningensis TaxID=1419482 RepID=A0A1M7FZ49_9BACT|nr:ABC transporter permease [Chitinophaga jiangningensis]SHM09098.1 ABC-type antimicrobial peptide transport system, permease component [Chitinophaga jiangningensis]
MIRNYLKSAWRNCKSNPGYTLLNVSGLAIGMAVTLLIGMWAYEQYTYNKFLPDYKQVYQLKTNYINNDGQMETMPWVSIPLTEGVRNEVTGVEKSAITDVFSKRTFVVGDKKFEFTGGAADVDFLDIFRIPVLRGGKDLLQDPNSIVLTKSTAKAIFGDADPMNKIVKVDNQFNLRVTGIIEDVPGNATVPFDFVFPFKILFPENEWMQNARSDFGNNSFQCFVKLAPGVNPDLVAKQASGLIAKGLQDSHLTAMLHPASQWRLYDHVENGKPASGFISYVRMFMSIGILILLIACINFVNLSVAQSDKRAKEVGVRKAIGSGKTDLILQFLTQSLLLTVIATVCSLLLLAAVLPAFNALAGSELKLPVGKPAAWGVLLAFIMLVTLLAGSRPAFVLSAYRPVIVLKGLKQPGKKGSGVMKTMVIIQFAASIALIIATATIYQQIQYGKSRPTGYNISGLVSTEMTLDLSRNFTALKNDLLASGAVKSVTAATSPTTAVWSHSVINDWKGKTTASANYLNVARVAVMEDYFNTTGMQLKEGRDFHSTIAADSNTVIVNEAAVKQLGLASPIGQMITWNGTLRAQIVGVVKDALMVSPFTPSEPTVFYHSDKNGMVIYRLSEHMPTADALEKTSRIFQQYNPTYLYNYTFADVDYQQKFKMETLTGKLAGIFAVLAIFVSCLGLLGLAALTAATRTKEIAIRKVMGASVTNLWLLLSTQFVVLVMIGGAIAVPVAWMGLNSWLSKYAYHTEPSPILFAAALLLAVLITVCTVSYQAIRAALLNPVHSLKSQ